MESTRSCTLVLHSLSKETTILDVESILLGVAKECQLDCIPKIRELSPNVPRRSRDWMAEVCQVSMEDQQRMAQMQGKVLMNGKVLKMRCGRSHKDPHHMCAFSLSLQTQHLPQPKSVHIQIQIPKLCQFCWTNAYHKNQLVCVHLTLFFARFINFKPLVSWHQRKCKNWKQTSENSWGNSRTWPVNIVAL